MIHDKSDKFDPRETVSIADRHIRNVGGDPNNHSLKGKLILGALVTSAVIAIGAFVRSLAV